MKKLSVFLIALHCLNCRQGEVVRTVEIVPDSIQAKLNYLTNQRDSLIKLVKESNTNYWFDPDYVDEDVFNAKGITNPADFVDSAFRSNIKLLPMKGILGGTMRFDSIQLLSSEWLITNYDDGHIQGKSIYEYKFSKNGKITFRLIASIEDE